MPNHKLQKVWNLKLRTSQSGFTLIELMVVIAIIAILAAVGAVVYSQAQQNGRDSKRTQDVQEIQKAVEQYYAINSSYPDNSATPKTENSDSIPGLNTYFQGNVTPVDPAAATSPYKYIVGGTCSGSASPHYIICAKLENCGTNKCNRNVLPVDGCQSANDGVSPAKYYCVSP